MRENYQMAGCLRFNNFPFDQRGYFINVIMREAGYRIINNYYLPAIVDGIRRDTTGAGFDKIEQRNNSFFTFTQRSEYILFPWIAYPSKPVKFHLLVMAADVEVSYAQCFQINIDGIDGRLNN